MTSTDLGGFSVEVATRFSSSFMGDVRGYPNEGEFSTAEWSIQAFQRVHDRQKTMNWSQKEVGLVLSDGSKGIKFQERVLD